MNKPATIGLIAVALLIVGGAIWYYTQPVKKQPTKPLTLEEVREVLRQKTMALSYLEDADFELARPILNSLIQRLPDENFGYRNLVIGGLQQIDALGRISESNTASKRARDEARKKKAAAVAWVKQAVDQLLEFDKKSGIAQVLAARFFAQTAQGQSDDVARQNEAKQIELLQAATRLASDNAAIWHELFTTLKNVPGKQDDDQIFQALQKVRSLAPNNLRVELEWSILLANREDKTIAESIPRLRKMASTAIIQHPVNEALTLLDEADRLAKEESDWSKVFSNVLFATNIINGQEVTKSDRDRVKLNNLEFLVFDFSEDFYQRNPQPVKVKEPAISVNGKPLKIAGIQPGTVHWIEANDFDLDGKADLIVLRDDRLEVYSGKTPTSVQLLLSVELSGRWTGFRVADMDLSDGGSEILNKIPTPKRGDGSGCQPLNEAFLDVVLYGPSGIQIFKHDMVDATDAQGKVAKKHVLLPVKQEHASVQNVPAISRVEVVDMDHDGLLDIIAARQTEGTSGEAFSVWLTYGRMQYQDVSKFSQLPKSTGTYTRLIPVDIDRDLDVDIVVSGPGCTAYLLENRRQAQFIARPLKDKYGRGGECIDVLDADGNASWDLLCSGPLGTWLILTTNLTPGVHKVMKEIKAADTNFQDLMLIDYDNDGYQDILGRNSDNKWLTLRGVEAGFEAASSLASGDAAKSPVYFSLDWDRDGDLDLISNDQGAVSVVSNEGGNKNGWISLRLIGQHDNLGRSNHDGLGSLMELKAGTRYQARIARHPITHFGLGSLKQAEAIRILWTNGIPQVAILPERNQSICELMELKGSCPYLYTWNGKQWRFHTDLLWAAPIGLQVAEGKLAPSRPWEYLLIEGEHLQPKNGYYELRVTEELWEAAYFDQVRLLIVDHDRDVEVYTNEKVGPPSIAEHRIHTVSKRRYPVAARDKDGADVLQLVNQRDGKFFRGFERKFRQGLTDTHYLELDLGNLPKKPKNITLFLTGWFYPTDTSLNVAISRDKSLPQPQFPSIWVVNKQGKWQKTIPFMGFPGGKTKTIAVDLTNAFLTPDRRLRIQCNNELYWDEAFFTVDEKPATLNVQTASLVSADLHYRGFSRVDRPNRNAPERFHYDDCNLNPKWPPMRGNFTRYGDVLPLLTSQDGQLLVMASGDEVVLRFKVPQQKLAAGKKRDFVLHCVGWDKDADLNTVAGQQVEPLPFVGMKSYPYDLRGAPSSPQYRQYLRKYQNRQTYAPRFWKWVKNYHR